MSTSTALVDLSSYAGQYANYRSVRERLGAANPVIRVKATLGHIPPKQPTVTLLSHFPEHVDDKRRVRDIIDLSDLNAPVILDEKQPLSEGTPSWKRIIYECCKKHGISLVDIMSPRRGKAIVAARHEAMVRMRYETSMSLPQIGRRMNRDHSCVHGALEKHKAALARGDA